MKNKFTILSILLIALAIPFQAFAFTDMAANNNQQQAINFVAAQGIVSGYADGTYRPSNLINRAEFTKIVMMWLYKDKIGESNCFPDVRAQWFSSYICGAKSLSILQGYGDGFFKPANNITLAEALKIVLEAKKVSLPQVALSSPWYQEYWDYALQNSVLLQSIGQDPNHFITRGEMASLVFQASNFAFPAPYQAMNSQQISELSAIINKFPHNSTPPLEQKQYLTQNFANILSNFITMATYGQDDPTMQDILSQTAIIGVWTLPSIDMSLFKLYEAKIADTRAFMIYESTYTNQAYALSCISFQNENGWKVDRTKSLLTFDQTKKTLLQANIETECSKASPQTALLNAQDLQLAQQNFGSEYAYEVYLNGYLIESEVSGVNTRGLPLKTGSNELKIVIGKSLKNTIGSSDPFFQLAQNLNGFQYHLTVAGKELVSVESHEPDTTIVKTFSYQK